MSKTSPVACWIPVNLYLEDDSLLCRWLYVDNKDFTEPFFDETISACRSMYQKNWHTIKCISSTEVLPDWVKEMDVFEPTAFIFHISRCGSTLISQLLGVQDSNIVLSEVPFFDDLLRYGNKQKCMAEILPQLKAAIGFYGTKRNENHRHLFIKTDSWHIHFYKGLRALFPSVPFFLLYRKPDEVLRSQQKKRGMQAIPNLLEASIFGFDEEKISTLPLDEYMGLVIESYLTVFTEVLQHDKAAYAINYHDGAMEIINTIASITGLKIPENEKKLMQKRAGFHAKFPEQIFTEDLPVEDIPGFLKRSFQLYEHLEQIRLKGG